MTSPCFTRAILSLALALAPMTALADYWQYTYIGEPADKIEASGDNRYAQGRATVSFQSTVLLSVHQTYSLLTTPSISHVVVNWDTAPLGDPRVTSTFAGYPGAVLDSFYSYVVIGDNTDTIAQWEIAKYFRPIADPSPGIVVTTGYAPGYPGFKPFCVFDCAAFDRIELDGTGAWGYDHPGRWSVTLVPEPSTWALLIAGLGVVGWRLRRQGRTLATSSYNTASRRR